MKKFPFKELEKQKKALEHRHRLWYIKHKERHLLVTGVLQELPIDG